ncbi:MAG: ABC transporter permease [Planctomycetota bacterium]|jgi:putative ABC transport system permease protein
MKLSTIVKRELLERKHQLFTSFVTIVLGVAAIVSINNITHFSEEAIKQELERLGANVLILPKGSTVENYFAADMGADVLPETYVAKLSNSGLHGMDNLSPKLSEPVVLNGKKYTLTGILPKNEIRGKAAWSGGFGLQGIAPQPSCAPLDLKGKKGSELLAKSRIVDELGENELFVGYEAATSLKLTKGSTLDVNGRTFTVTAILPITGSVDDARLFAHLHTVQKMTKKEGAVGVIEVIGCCEQIFDGLVGNINKLLPDAKVVTISQVVATQQKTNKMMEKLSWAFLILIALVGGASIANYMYGNVYERQHEIGSLMALGADTGFITKLFLLKATILGLTGGLAGFVVGTGLAMGLGPEIAGIQVSPLPVLIPVAVGISLVVALLATWFPARKAAQIDPCVAFRDV